MPEERRYISLSWKFATIILIAGILPLLFFTTAAIRWLSRDYRAAILASYENAARYISKSIDSELDSLNDISKVVYFYNPANAEQHQYSYMNFDNLRQILLMQDPQLRRQDMEVFLGSIYYVDSAINSVYFVGASEEWRYAYLGGISFMSDWDKLAGMLEERNMDTESRNMLLIAPHTNDYLHAENDRVFMVGRNYYDISSSTLTDQPYLGTLLLDVDTDLFAGLFRQRDFGMNSEIYVYDGDGICYYSSREELLGENLYEENLCLDGTDGKLMIRIPENKYGLAVSVRLDEDTLYAPIRETQRLIYAAILAAMCFLILVAVFFARRLTRPVKRMMSEMAKLECGDFGVALPTDRNDEFGVLSRRFVDMSHQLENYIDQFYVAKLKQNEAEMTALKSQIYPHFLYNTLEIIRMTALDDRDGKKAAKMIEALSKQIHYMIGTLQDFVCLEKETEIVEKYVYLLNCRISGQIDLVTALNGFRKAWVPKLILQPIVENAYVHGLKPTGGSGQIKISAELEGEDLVISVMDDGVGMDEEKVQELYALLDSDAVGIRQEDDWQSIGMKNVHDRVRYLFGEGYGIRITSRKSVGTFIRIRMPYRERDENVEDDHSG